MYHVQLIYADDVLQLIQQSSEMMNKEFLNQAIKVLTVQYQFLFLLLLVMVVMMMVVVVVMVMLSLFESRFRPVFFDVSFLE